MRATQLYLWGCWLGLLWPVDLCAQKVKGITLQTGLVVSNQNFHYPPTQHQFDNITKLGTSVELSLNWLGHDRFDIVTQAGYIQKGSHLNLFFFDGTAFKNRYHYLSFSPMMQFKYPFNKFTPYLSAGPRMDYLMNTNQLSWWYGTEGIERSSFHTITYGFNYGVGLEVNVGMAQFVLNIQHQPDINNVIAQAPTINAAGLQVNNRAILFSIGGKVYTGVPMKVLIKNLYQDREATAE